MNTQAIVAPGPQLLAEVRALCDVAFGGEFSDSDWAHTLGGTHVVRWSGGVVVAHAAVVERSMWIGERTARVGYVEGVATVPDRQGAGLGSAVMSEVDRIIAEQFELGALSTSAASFYERLGWERWRGATYVQTATERIRTVDEDDGIMVLRPPTAAPIDLTADLTCRERDGDDW